MYAASNNHKDCVKLLLQHNSDVKHEDDDGNTAYELTNNQEIKALLR